jgi:hypothetical protein
LREALERFALLGSKRTSPIVVCRFRPGVRPLTLNVVIRSSPTGIGCYPGTPRTPRKEGMGTLVPIGADQEESYRGQQRYMIERAR